MIITHKEFENYYKQEINLTKMGARQH